MIILENTKEPIFASNVKVKGKYIVYYDMDGLPASCNFSAGQQFMKCCICGNCCVQYMVDDDGTFTCSACGKFPRELLQS